MKEGDLPFFSPEGEHNNSENDDDSENLQEKKKKSTFKKWVEFFVPKRKREESAESSPGEEAHQDRAEGVFARARGFLNRLTGVDAEIEPDDTEVEPEENSYDPLARRRFDFSNLLELEEDQQTSNVGVESVETQRVSHPDLEDDQVISEIEERPQDHVDDVRPIDTPSEIDPHEQREPIREAGTSTDEENNTIYETPTVQTEAIERDEEKEQQQPTVVERRGSGAALAGFVAGELLSRSRDKKLKKEATKLKEQLNDQQLHTKEQDIELLKQKQELQRQSLQQKRSVESFEQHTLAQASIERVQKNEQAPRNSSTEEAQQPIINKEAHWSLAQDRLEKPLQKEKPTEAHSVMKGKEHDIRPDEVARTEKVVPPKFRPEVSKNEQLHLHQIEQAAENDVALEAFYEKQHESKDVSSTQSPHAMTSFKMLGSNHSAQQHLDADVPEHLGSDKHLLNKRGLPQEVLHSSKYRQAIKQGIVAGLMLIISLCLIALIWSLL